MKNRKPNIYSKGFSTRRKNENYEEVDAQRFIRCIEQLFEEQTQKICSAIAAIIKFQPE
ncbi:hypothetical protein NC981_17910 [Leptolyngbya sp. DQ-M1]|uniref:hypothetical protein n=1 Tax=Leptolyngbya sp. DQ-M1 TaxID=2933920 RepID=UPI0032993048